MVGNFNCWDVEIKISSHTQETKYAIRLIEMNNQAGHGGGCLQYVTDEAELGKARV